MRTIVPVKTSIEGRIKKLKLSKDDGLLPIFEAVVNSIQSIEERASLNGSNFHQSDGKIEVILYGDENDLIGNIKRSDTPVKKIEVIDNGIGFTNENYDSFLTADSIYKEDKGCKGIGHFQWLKLFNKIEIESYFNKENKSHGRKFQFSIDGISVDNIDGLFQSDNEHILQTTITFLNVRKDSPLSTYFNKNISNLANLLFSHLIWYYLDESYQTPSIKVIDQRSGNTFNLDDFAKNIDKSDITNHIFDIENVSFVLKCFKKRKDLLKKSTVTLHYTADDREVMQSSITDKLFLSSNTVFKDEKGCFNYEIYAKSEYFNSAVNADRTQIMFANDESQSSLFQEFKRDDIENEVIKIVKKDLKEVIENDRVDKLTILSNFIEKKPQYRFIFDRINKNNVDDDIFKFDTNNKKIEQELDIHFHRIKTNIEEKNIKQGDLLKNISPTNFDPVIYQKKLKEYLDINAELNQSELAKYVVHRKVVLEILEKSLQFDENGQYNRESVLHNIIFPMRQKGNNIKSEENNLWIIGEELAFSSYIASDVPLKNIEISESKSDDRPDILTMQLYNNNLLFADQPRSPFSSFTIIEFKRPMRTNISDHDGTDPFTQIFRYCDELKNNKIKTPQGRPVTFGRGPIFAYIIADLTDNFVSKCEERDLQKSSDDEGYFGYIKNKNLYITVISYDGLLSRATKRNQAFFTKLNI